jgi:hypothetical protein
LVWVWGERGLAGASEDGAAMRLLALALFISGCSSRGDCWLIESVGHTSFLSKFVGGSALSNNYAQLRFDSQAEALEFAKQRGMLLCGDLRP